jgi:hypothetical protein
MSKAIKTLFRWGKGKTILTPNKWHHLVTISDGSVQKLYIDGKKA